MATIRRRGKYWQAQVIRKGYPAQYRSFDTKTQAQQWSLHVESEMKRGVFVSRAEAETHTVGELIDDYLKEVTPGKKSARNEEQRLRFLRAEFGVYKLAGLQPKHVAAFRDKRLAEGKAASTVVKDLNSLSHVIDVAVKDWGVWIPSNPVKNVRRPTMARGRDRRLTKDEERLLLKACRESRSPALEPLVRLALETAMRLGELLALDWSHVDPRKRIAHLPDTKSGEARAVPLSKDAVKILRALPRATAGRVFPYWARADSFENSWRRALRRARSKHESSCKKKGKTADRKFLADLRFHDLRHEATSRLFEKGLNPMEVAAITGHKTLQMLKRYTHLLAEDLARKLG